MSLTTHELFPFALSVTQRNAVGAISIDQWTDASNPTNALSTLAIRLEASLALSRPVLIGSRDPRGVSCVRVVTRGQVMNFGFDNFFDSNGGAGSTITSLYRTDRQNIRSAKDDFAWFQGRFKTYLQNQSALNRSAFELANDVAQQAMRFHRLANSWNALPNDLVSTRFNSRTDWPGYCMASLNQAISARDLAQTRRWAGELATATFAMADLHRWLGFLVENHLTALSFQKDCEELFQLTQPGWKPYNLVESPPHFPAGILTGNGVSNYYEIERQAEMLLSVPEARLRALTNEKLAAPELIWIMPMWRESYLQWRSVLNPENQKTLDLASRSPFQRSYLMNMLFRHNGAGTVSHITNVLKRFDSISPSASIDELMDVLMYRGHSFGGLEWDDRFHSELNGESHALVTSRSPVEALSDACSWTNRFYNRGYYRSTYTLHQAIAHKQLDCVRATDMIGTIFRNAGHSRFGHARWCAGTNGHSVAAHLGTENNQTRTLLEDGLNPTSQPEVWPDAYFNGHVWPPNLIGNPTPFAVELYGRGLDSYIWLEGYIVRGPNAGQLTTAVVPYLEGRERDSTRTVFAGPYPM